MHCYCYLPLVLAHASAPSVIRLINPLALFLVDYTVFTVFLLFLFKISTKEKAISLSLYLSLSLTNNLVYLIWHVERETEIKPCNWDSTAGLLQK